MRTAASVDGKTGALTYSPSADLIDGWGGFPKSLSLQRVYDQRDQTNYGLGIGWKTNWYQVATMNNDGMAALGRSGAAGVASALVAIQAVGDLVTTQDTQHLYAASQVAAWLTDQTMNNSVVVAKGLDGEQTFYRQASGTYVAGRPDGATLTVAGASGTGIINRRIYPNYTSRFTDAAGSTRTYTQAGAPGSAGTAAGSVVLPTSKTEKINAGASTVTTYNYDPSNDLDLKEQVVDSGGLSLRTCFKLDAAGNLISTTAPKAGLAVCQ